MGKQIMRRIGPLFSAFSAEIVLARAEIRGYNLRKMCGD
jgi:hypothetical protein